MTISRRKVIKLAAGLPFALTGIRLLGNPSAAKAVGRLELRTVTDADAVALQAIMTSCVTDEDSFFGPCGDWQVAWARRLIRRCPATQVITADGEPVAFFELPPIPSPIAVPASDAGEEARLQYALRDRNRKTFWVTAAGIRDDLFTPEDSLRMFLTIFYRQALAARDLGYEYGEAYVPWERHPLMHRAWTDFPGCELVAPPAYEQGGVRRVYWLRWRLEDAIPAFRAMELFDVA